MEGLFKAEDGQTVGSDHTTEWWKKCMSARYNRVSRFHFVPSSANCLVWRQRRLHLKINTIFKYACGQSFSPTTCVKSNSKSIKGRGSNVCANMEVSLVQHEILVSKMPSFGIGSNHNYWPKVAMGKSRNRHKAKTVERLLASVI